MTDYGKVALRRIDELYLELYKLKTESVSKTSSVSVTSGAQSLISKFNKILRFRSYDGAILIFSLYVNVSTSSTLRLTIDGEEIFNGIVQSGGCVKDFRLTGIGSGEHEVEAVVTASRFNLISFSLTITGNLYEAYGDLFLLPFPSGDYALKLDMNRLDVIEVSSGKITTGFSVDGVLSVRQCYGSASAFAVVMKTGSVFILDFEDSITEPSLTPVCESAVSACAIKRADGIDVFCADDGGVKHYLLMDSAVELLGEIKISAGDISAWSNGAKTVFIAEKNGFLTLYESLRGVNYTTADRFTLSYKEE